MEIKDMTVEEMEARKAEIRAEVEGKGADLDALEAEARAINEEIENRRNAEAQRVEIRKAVAEGEGEVVKEIKSEVRNLKTLEEVRASAAYEEAYANYIKTDDDSECRALLTETVYDGSEGQSGPVPVPVVIEGRIRTAWERNGLMDLVRKSYFRGILKVGFELSASPAAVHVEGAEAPDEEQLSLGIVSLVPVSLKKYITISDEAVDMGAREFLDYIYDEITYQIAKLAQASLISAITAAGTTATANAVSVAEVESDGTDILGIVATAISELSDAATNPVIVMNKKTYASFISARNNAEYGVDPFEGLSVYYDNTLAALADADEGDCWLIVGDFGVGAQANFPNGDEIRIKYDDLSLAELDMVKIVGREYVGLGLVSDKAFCRVVVPEA